MISATTEKARVPVGRVAGLNESVLVCSREPLEYRKPSALLQSQTALTSMRTVAAKAAAMSSHERQNAAAECDGLASELAIQSCYVDGRTAVWMRAKARTLKGHASIYRGALA
ncbi:MAG: hypothetical protein RJA87_1297 [Pseudomonadota bacterium]|jgi:hypothetical protein